MKPTPSMRATTKYIWIVSLLILVQMVLGAITAHYGVEGDALFGLPIQDFLPQAVSRSWHVQLAILWIATSWLATGLYIAPAVSGVEPKFQRLGGERALRCAPLCRRRLTRRSVVRGHAEARPYRELLARASGLRYVELGRLWQILLLVGLVLWLFLMIRALDPRSQAQG